MDEQRRSCKAARSRIALPLNMLQTFDLPAITPNCQRRDTSTVTPQALWFMNDQSLIQLSQQMAQSLIGESEDAPQRTRAAYLRALAAEPSEEELAECSEFLSEQAETFRAASADVLPASPDPAIDAVQLQSLASLCQIILSSNRFLTNHDWLATVLRLFGLDHRELKFRVGSRNLALVEDAAATVVDKILA